MQIKDIETYTNLELVRLFKQTNNNYYVGVLFQRHTHLILGLCMKYLKNEEDAQDASILIFEKLLNDLPKYEITNFKTWLYSSCKTFCLMYMRSAASKYNIDNKIRNNFDEIMESELKLHLYNEDNLEQEIHLTFMEECMEGLNKEQRLCLDLFFLKEKSYLEVTEQTKLTINNVKSHIQNGKRNLKNCIESKIE